MTRFTGFQITMGQAFRGALEAALKEMGALDVRPGEYADDSTTWTVLAAFPVGTKRRDVAQLLWAKWPSASVTVERFPRPKRERSIQVVRQTVHLTPEVAMRRNADMQPYPGEFDGEDFAPGHAYNPNTDLPTVELIGQDGNAFAICGACQRAARKAGWSPEQWSKVRDEITSGGYDHLLATAQKYFDVE